MSDTPVLNNELIHIILFYEYQRYSYIIYLEVL